MVGSFGYSAPEFAMSGVYTVKSDVYSFGVVMLELLTGRKPLDRSILNKNLVLLEFCNVYISVCSLLIFPLFFGACWIYQF